MAFTPEEEAELKALLEDSKRTYELKQLSSSDDYDLVVDNTSRSVAGKINKSQLFYDGTIEGQSAADKNIACSNYSFANTSATTGRAGTLKTASDTTASGLTDSERALVAANMPSVFESVFKNVTNYNTTNVIDSITGATLVGGSVARWVELNVGDGVVKGHLAFTMNVDDTAEVVILANTNSKNLPPHIQAGSFMHYEALTTKVDAFDSGGCTLAVDSEKLQLKLTRGAVQWDNAQNPIFCVINYEIFL